MRTCVALLLGLAALVTTGTAYADQSVSFENGFATLAADLGDAAGTPIEAEHGTSDGYIIQQTTTGLMLWKDGIAPQWTDGYARAAVVAGRGLVDWVGDTETPPAPPARVLDTTPVQVSGGLRGYAFSAYPDLARCIEQIAYGESSGWVTTGYNRRPWGRYGEHASGLGGFLPSTWASTPQAGRSIWDGNAQVDAIAWMIRAKRGKEFAEWGYGACRL